jgi:23S rRNA pseudouridine2605 synthase
MERLQKVIANSGYCSRRKAEELISSGKVKVNGCIVSELGYKVDGNDEVIVGNKVISREEKEYILLNKPRGVVTTTSDDKNRKTVIDLINTDKRLYPVGRLDYDTTGALLLTNDGELTNLLIHPRNKVDKVYIAKVRGFFDKESASKMARGVMIDDFKTSRCFVKLRKYDKKSDSSIVEVIIHEGKNHQVKRMFEAVGFDVLKLKREMFAFLNVNGLKSGEYRYLSIKEVKQLYSLVK